MGTADDGYRTRVAQRERTQRACEAFNALALALIRPAGQRLAQALALQAALKRDYDTATLLSLTQGHSSELLPEDSWADMLDVTMAG